jgi:hypothetical protein
VNITSWKNVWRKKIKVNWKTIGVNYEKIRIAY